MPDSEVEGSRRFKSSPLQQPVRFLRSYSESRRKFSRSWVVLTANSGLKKSARIDG